MASSKNPLPTPLPWRSRRSSTSASLIMASCFLLTLPFLVFLLLSPAASTLSLSSPSAIPPSHLLSLSSLSSAVPHPRRPPNDAVSPPPAPVIPRKRVAGSRTEESTDRLRSCDLFNGSWVVDRAEPLYPPGSCPNVDDAFNCFNNGRQDRNYLHYRWKPHACDIPRFDGRRMMSMLKNKRVVFVGDSLNRNMWQSLICSLRHALPNATSTLKQSKFSHSFSFKDYNCTIDYIKSPFLVQRWRIKGFQGTRRETLRLDIIQDTPQYHTADVIVYNTGHWWTHHKTKNGTDYFQEGEHVHAKLKVDEAFKRALRTWASWVDRLIDSNRTLVFFAGYTASHFKGGQWDTGGGCSGEDEPIMEESQLSEYPWMMKELETVLPKMKTRVTYLNISRMTDYRKDAHPSIYRFPSSRTLPPPASGGGGAGGAVRVQDCSHWCLPGVPDSWNQILYGYLLMMLPHN